MHVLVTLHDLCMPCSSFLDSIIIAYMMVYGRVQSNDLFLAVTDMFILTHSVTNQVPLCRKKCV